MIKSVHIKNFKSIKEAKVQFPFFGGIIGANGAGKSNLLQSINFLKKLVRGESISSASAAIAVAPLEMYNNNETSTEMYLCVELSDKSDTIYKYEITLRVTNITGTDNRLIVEKEFLTKVSDEHESLVFERLNNQIKDKEKDLPLEISEDILAIFLYKNPDAEQVRLIFDKMIIPETGELDNRESIVHPSERGLASIVVRMKNNHPEYYEQFVQIIRKILPTFAKLIEVPSAPDTGENKPDVQTYLVLLEEKNLRGVLSMKSISTGDLRTLYIIASAMNMSEGTFIVEEIENGIHPKRLKDLIDRLQTISLKREIQIIFTTHSPVIINHLAPHDIIFAHKKPDTGSAYLNLSLVSQSEAIEKFLNSGGELTDYISTKL